jgi:aspartate oxidase
MSNYVGIVRSNARLKRAIDRLYIHPSRNGRALFQVHSIGEAMRAAQCHQVAYLIVKHPGKGRRARACITTWIIRKKTIRNGEIR